MSFVLIAIAVTLRDARLHVFVRAKDVPEAPPVNPPYQHLEGRKAAIYENLRDLQFEYRVGKLSDEDYQRTKKEYAGRAWRTFLPRSTRSQQKPAPAAAAESKAGRSPGAFVRIAMQSSRSR